jgi:hypothetical protein
MTAFRTFPIKKGQYADCPVSSRPSAKGILISVSIALMQSGQFLFAQYPFDFLKQMIRGFFDPTDVLLVHRIVRDELKRIFQPFELLNDLGLDLPVAQALIQVQNGFHTAFHAKPIVLPVFLLQKPFEYHDRTHRFVSGSRPPACQVHV